MSLREAHAYERAQDRTLAEPSPTTSVVLVCMPFGPNVLQPSLGLSLLKASLGPSEVSSRVLYFSLKLAERIGISTYTRISTAEPTRIGFAGDWAFAGVLYDSVAHDVDEYVDKILRIKGVPSHQTRDKMLPLPEEEIEEILAVRAMAPEFIEECLREVLAHSPRVVGFTSTFQQHVASLALARRIKQEAPGVVTLLGGTNCDGVMGAETLRQFEFIDGVVSGEGDLVFPRLVERILDGEDWTEVPGVHARRGNRLEVVDSCQTMAPMVRDMDALPYPDYGDFFAQLDATDLGDREELDPPRLMFETSRGCWWGERSHCTFCGLNGSMMSYRAKSEKRALEELLHVHGEHPECPISFTDNILDMRYFKSFLPGLAALEVDLELFYEVKANLRKDQIRMLRDAGVCDIQPGIESLLDEVLRIMRKGVSRLQNIQLLKWCKELGVIPHWNMLWGFPGEPPEAYSDMVEWLPLLYHLSPPSGVGMIRLDRFSPNFDSAEELGFTEVAPYPAYGYIYRLDDQALFNIAYFFTYRRGDSRDARAYTGAVRGRIEDWKSRHRDCDLFYVDKGDLLLVWDFRPLARQPLTVLREPLRSLYIECDRIRSLRQLETALERIEGGDSAAGAGVEGLLRLMVDGGFMIRGGDAFLSLAIPVGEYSPRAEILARLQSAVEELTRASGGSTGIPLEDLELSVELERGVAA